MSCIQITGAPCSRCRNHGPLRTDELPARQDHLSTRHAELVDHVNDEDACALWIEADFLLLHVG